VKQGDNHVYYRYLSEVRDQEDDDELDEVKESSSFGQVKFIALNSKRNLLAMYCDPETSGRMIVMKADMRAVLDDKDTK